MVDQSAWLVVIDEIEVCGARCACSSYAVPSCVCFLKLDGTRQQHFLWWNCSRLAKLVSKQKIERFNQLAFDDVCTCQAKDLRKMDVLSDSDPFVQFTIVPSQRNLAGGKKSKKSLNQRQGKHAFLSNFWKSNTYTIDNCHNPKYQCCCMLFLGNINEQVFFSFCCRW